MTEHNETPVSPRTKRLTQVERRASAESRLLRATAELVALQGPAATSIAQICEHAGFSRGIVNHHFGTRTALFERLAIETQAAFIAGLPSFRAKSGLEAIITVARSYLNAMRGTDPSARAFLLLWAGAAGADDELRPALATSDEEFRTAIQELVDRGIADGSVNAGLDSEAIAVSIVGLLRGTGLQCFVNPEILSPSMRDRIVNVVATMLTA